MAFRVPKRGRSKPPNKQREFFHDIQRSTSGIKSKIVLASKGLVIASLQKYNTCFILASRFLVPHLHILEHSSAEFREGQPVDLAVLFRLHIILQEQSYKGKRNTNTL